MPAGGAGEAAGMSPLARLIRAKQAGGLTLREMQIAAHERGFKLTDTAISQIANDERRGRLRPRTIEALAAALHEPPDVIARLDDERWQLPQAQEEVVITAEEAIRREFPPHEAEELIAVLRRYRSSGPSSESPERRSAG